MLSSSSHGLVVHRTYMFILILTIKMAINIRHDQQATHLSRPNTCIHFHLYMHIHTCIYRNYIIFFITGHALDFSRLVLSNQFFPERPFRLTCGRKAAGSTSSARYALSCIPTREYMLLLYTCCCVHVVNMYMCVNVPCRQWRVVRWFWMEATLTWTPPRLPPCPFQLPLAL